MVDEIKTISEDEVRKAEQAIKDKEAAAKKAEDEKYKKLLDEAEKKGKDEALNQFKAEQDKQAIIEAQKKLEEENDKLRQELLKSSQAAENKVKELAAKIEDMEARSKGLAKNESPFQGQTQVENRTPLTKEQIAVIDVASRRAFEEKHGIKIPE